VLLGLQGAASPSLLGYGRARLDPIRGHNEAPTGSPKSRVHDGGGACDLPCARGPRFSHANGGIRGGLLDVL
jgi:hypothetical protein